MANFESKEPRCWGPQEKKGENPLDEPSLPSRFEESGSTGSLAVAQKRGVQQYCNSVKSESPHGQRFIRSDDGEVLLQLVEKNSLSQMKVDGAPSGRDYDGRATFLEVVAEVVEGDRGSHGALRSSPIDLHDWHGLMDELSHFVVRAEAFYKAGLWDRAVRDVDHVVVGIEMLKRLAPSENQHLHAELFEISHLPFMVVCRTYQDLRTGEVDLAYSTVSEGVQHLDRVASQFEGGPDGVRTVFLGERSPSYMSELTMLHEKLLAEAPLKLSPFFLRSVESEDDFVEEIPSSMIERGESLETLTASSGLESPDTQRIAHFVDGEGEDLLLVPHELGFDLMPFRGDPASIFEDRSDLGEPIFHRLQHDIDGVFRESHVDDAQQLLLEIRRYVDRMRWLPFVGEVEGAKNDYDRIRDMIACGFDLFPSDSWQESFTVEANQADQAYFVGMMQHAFREKDYLQVYSLYRKGMAAIDLRQDSLESSDRFELDEDFLQVFKRGREVLTEYMEEYLQVMPSGSFPKLLQARDFAVKRQDFQEAARLRDRIRSEFPHVEPWLLG